VLEKKEERLAVAENSSRIMSARQEKYHFFLDRQFCE
jgi:hypothetical protein